MTTLSPSPPFHQLLYIVNGLNANRNLNAKKLAAEMAVSERTVKRYIHYLREELHLTIIWEPTSRSYYCEQPIEGLPLLQVTGEEALSLALAGRTFAAWKGSPLGDALDSVIRKVATVVKGAVTIPISDLQGILSLPEDQFCQPREHQWFGVLLDAIKFQREIRIDYKKVDCAAAARSIHPLHLLYVEQAWAVVAWDPAKAQPRKFLLSRMEDVRPTGRYFTPPVDFDLAAYIQDSLGLFAGTELHAVQIICDRQVTAYLREKPLHPSQTLEEHADGSAMLRLALNHLLDIQRWVLSWGHHVEAIAPAELRANVAKEVQALADMYEKTTKSYSQGQNMSQVVG